MEKKKATKRYNPINIKPNLYFEGILIFLPKKNQFPANKAIIIRCLKPKGKLIQPDSCNHSDKNTIIVVKTKLSVITENLISFFIIASTTSYTLLLATFLSLVGKNIFLNCNGATK